MEVPSSARHWYFDSRQVRRVEDERLVHRLAGLTAKGDDGHPDGWPSQARLRSLEYRTAPGLPRGPFPLCVSEPACDGFRDVCPKDPDGYPGQADHIQVSAADGQILDLAIDRLRSLLHLLVRLVMLCFAVTSSLFILINRRIHLISEVVEVVLKGRDALFRRRILSRGTNPSTDPQAGRH